MSGKRAGFAGAMALSLLSASRWAGADQEAVSSPAPCRDDPNTSAFDFWVGAFRVESGSGEFLGSNLIEKEQGGCVLVERWTGATGSTGISLTFWDPGRDRWRQVWTSPGVIIDIDGGLQGASMVLEGSVLYRESGEARRFRGTWTPLERGVVRQFFEESRHDGSTFSPWFEGFYHRVQPPPVDAGP